MLWFDLSEQLNHTRPGRDGGENGKGRIVRELMDWNRDSLLGKAKAAHVSKTQ